MANRKLLDSDIGPLRHEFLIQVLDYDITTGVFSWKKYMSATASAGDTAGSVRKIGGYRLIRINRKSYLAHRLAWFYVHGVWPPNEIDHINGTTDDNRVCNLRLATRGQNQQNIRYAKCNNKSCGLQGVTE